MSLYRRTSSDISSAHLDATPRVRTADPWVRVRAWRMRYVPVRATLVALAAVCFGLWITRGAIPTVSTGEISAYICSHSSDGDTAAALWMRLLAAQLPLYVLLFCAGLTRFSGALTNGVLLVSGMTDGATLALLWHSASVGTIPTVLPVAYCLRAAVEIALRVCMATVACRLARRMDDRQREQGVGNDTLIPATVRYVATFVLVIASVAVACLGYVVLAF